MSASRLLVLGVIRTQGQAHGYWVYRELMAWRIETWANVQPGSIYHAIKQLDKQRFITAVHVEDSEEGPNRTIYRLTEQGEIEFYRLLEEAFGSLDMHYFGAAIAFMRALPTERVIALIRQRLATLEKTRGELATMSQQYAKVEQPPQHRILFSQWVSYFDAAIGWTRGLIAQLEAE